MNLNVVFNLESLDELVQLTSALTDLKSIKARAKLEQDIKDLAKKRSELKKEVSILEEEESAEERDEGKTIPVSFLGRNLGSWSPLIIQTKDDDDDEETIEQIAGNENE